MKRYLMLVVCAIFICMFTGCSSDDVQYEYKIFYLDKEETQLVYEGYNTETDDIDELIEEFINKLSTVPEIDDAQVPGLDITYILDFEYTPEGNIILNFDSDYELLGSVKETLCRAAIVKTLCQIDGVNGVEFCVENRTCRDNFGVPYGYMSEESFVDNTSGETTYKQTMNVNVYFGNATGRMLVKVPIAVTFDGTISLEQLVVQQIIKGPKSIKGVDDSLLPTVSEKTTINQITVRDQICYLDVSKDFLAGMPDVTKAVTLYSVVNSLVELNNINKVQFSIDGEIVSSFGDSSIVFDAPLDRSLEIVKE